MSAASWPERLAARLLTRPRAVLAGLLAVTLGLGLAATRLHIDSSVEGLLPEDDPEVAFYRGLTRRFGSDELVIIGLQTRALFERPALEAIQRISRALRDITLEADGAAEPIHPIDRVLSLATALEVHGERDADGGSTFSVGRLLRELPETPEQSRALRERALSDPLYVGNFLASDPGDPEAPLTTLVLGRLVERTGDRDYRHRVVEQVEAMLARERDGPAGIGPFYLAGTAVLKATLAAMAERELAKFLPMVMGLNAAALWLLYRSARATALPLAVVGLATVWTLGFLTLCGSRLTIVSVVIVPLVSAIGVATSVYILSEDERLARAGGPAAERLPRTLGVVLVPSFAASLTTALGFLSLTTSSIRLIREVGLYSAFGVASAWLLAITLIPVALLYLPGAWTAPRARPDAAGADRPFDALAAATERFRWRILLGAVALMAIALVGVIRIRATTDLVGLLRRSHPLPVAYRVLERAIGGLHPLDVTLKTAPGRLLDPDVLARIDRFQQWLAAQPEVDHTFSYLDYLKRIHQEMHDSDPRELRLPDSRQEAASYLLLFDDAAGKRLEPFLYPDWEGAEEAIVLARTRSLPSAELASLVERIEDRIREAGLVEPEVAAHVTGSSVLYANMANSVVEGQVSSLTLSFLLIWGCVIALLRSGVAGSVAMIPNVFPILLLLGVMGFAGIELDIGTAMISAIAMGLVVDDTIHFLAHYRERRAELSAVGPAVRATLREVGRPMVATSLVLMLGFSVLVFSGFMPHVYMGLLGGMTIALALVGDLLVLPALLFLREGRSGRSRGEERPVGTGPRAALHPPHTFGG